MKAYAVLGLCLLLCGPGPAATAGEPGPDAPPEALVRALLAAKPDRVKPLERVLRSRGASVAPIVRAARAKAPRAGQRRLDRVLRRLELDWHRAKCPQGMVYVPAGPVETPRTKAPWGPSGERADVAAFYIGKTEVTVAQWRAWLATLEEAEAGAVKLLGLVRPGAHVSGTLPIARVRWGEAQRYAREVHAGRLPLASEFERALRGSSVCSYPWGESWRAGLANLADGGPGRVQPVGSYPKGAGPFGALDLVGNVAEWTGTLVRQGRSGRYPLVVGGSFEDRPDLALLWRGRLRGRPRMDRDERSPWVGFRVAKDPPRLP